MSKVQLAGNASGTGIFTIASPNSNTDRTLTLPDNTGTLLTSGSAIARTQMYAGAVLQVSQATLTTSFYTNSNGTFVDVTSLSVTITPTSSSSKFLLLASLVYGADFNANPCLRFTGGNSTNYVGDARGSRRRVAWAGGDDYFNGSSSTVSNQLSFTAQMTYLDSPATASAITYKVQAMGDANGGIYINRDPEDPDSSGEGYTAASSLIVMEIAA